VDIVRGTNMIYETGLFDVSYAVAEGNSQRVFVAFGESTWSWGVSWLLTYAREVPLAVACSALRIKASTRPPAQNAAAYQHRRRQAHRPHLNTRLFTPSAEEKRRLKSANSSSHLRILKAASCKDTAAEDPAANQPSQVRGESRLMNSTG
jgi:hypothetical protein